jgi:hypothetical protein
MQLKTANGQLRQIGLIRGGGGNSPLTEGSSDTWILTVRIQFEMSCVSSWTQEAQFRSVLSDSYQFAERETSV